MRIASKKILLLFIATFAALFVHAQGRTFRWCISSQNQVFTDVNSDGVYNPSTDTLSADKRVIFKDYISDTTVYKTIFRGQGAVYDPVNQIDTTIYYIVDTTVALGLYETYIDSIIHFPAPVITVLDDDLDTLFTTQFLCIGDSLRATGRILTDRDSVPIVDYRWKLDGKPDVLDSIIVVSENIDYSFQVSTEYCVVDWDIIPFFRSTPEITFSPEDPLAFCASEGSVDVEARSTNVTVDTYEWSFNNNVVGDSAILNVDESGVYSVRVTTSNGCEGNGELEVTINENPTLDIADVFFCPEYQIPIFIDSVLGAQYASTSDYSLNGDAVQSDTELNPFFDDFDATYTIEESDTNDCTVSDDFSLIYACVELSFPNVFSPDGDGINDAFIPFSAIGIRNLNFIIRNRWGRIVHESNDALNWDGKNLAGKDCSPGTYYYTVEYTDVLDEPQTPLKGTVTKVK